MHGAMEGIIGEIKLWAGFYIPENWAACNGQVLAVSNENTALFSLLGNMYGGDGRTTFGLPDLRGRVIVGSGQSKNNTNYPFGSTGGLENVSLTINEMPSHQHSFMVSNKMAIDPSPQYNVLAVPDYASDDVVFYLPEDPDEEKILPLQEDVLTETGSGSPHSNMMPYVVLEYIICMQGTYPKRQ